MNTQNFKVLALAAIAALAMGCERRAPMAVDSTSRDSALPATNTTISDSDNTTISDSEVPADYDPDENVTDVNSNVGTSGAGTNRNLDAGTADRSDGIVPETRKVDTSHATRHVDSTTEGGTYRDSWLDEDVNAVEDDPIEEADEEFDNEEIQARDERLDGTTGAGVTEMDRLKQNEALMEMNKHDASRWPVGTFRPMNERSNISTIGTTLPENHSIQ